MLKLGKLRPTVRTRAGSHPRPPIGLTSLFPWAGPWGVSVALGHRGQKAIVTYLNESLKPQGHPQISTCMSRGTFVLGGHPGGAHPKLGL